MSGARLYRPSAIGRVIDCPPSAVLPADDTGSSYANEGTAAHRLIEMSIRLEMSPADFKGDVIDVLGDDGQTIDQFIVTDDMIAATTAFLEYLDTTVDADKFQRFTETRLGSSRISSVIGSDFSGTIDQLFIPLTREQCGLGSTKAIIADYKHGAGVYVEVENNAQLLSYALFVFENYPHVETVDAHIFQPRARTEDPPGRFVTVTRDQAETMVSDILYAVSRGATYLEDPDSNVDLFNPSKSNCQFCPAQKNCPGLDAARNEMVALEFDQLPAVDNEQLARILEVGPMIVERAKQIAQEKLLSGEEVPGFKMVEAVARRKWKDEAEETLRKKKIRKSITHESKLRSPAQLEKAGVKKELIASLCFKPTGGLTLVSSTDRRAAITRSRPEDDFERLENDED